MYDNTDSDSSRTHFRAYSDDWLAYTQTRPRQSRAADADRWRAHNNKQQTPHLLQGLMILQTEPTRGSRRRFLEVLPLSMVLVLRAATVELASSAMIRVCLERR